MTFVFLPTDGLFLGSLLGLGGLLVRHLRQPGQRRTIRRLLRSRIAMVSAILLFFYLLLAVSDSIRIQSTRDDGIRATEPLSLLDYLLDHVRLPKEKTYSAPLAAWAYNRELVKGEDGHASWAYPRLEYGGRDLEDPSRDRWRDIQKRSLKGTGIGAGLWLMVSAMGLLIRKYLKRRRPEGDLAPDLPCLPWVSMILTFGFLCIASAVLYQVSLGYHVLGTDKVGQDVFYQSLKAVRTGVLIGTLTTLSTLPLALGLGIVAGYFRGWLDDLIQYLYTTLNSIPGVLLIAASMLIIQSYMARHEADFNSITVRADLRLMALCLILGLTSWTGLCRLLRAETLKVREMEFVLAARVMGVSTFRILMRHVLPNVTHLILISVALDFSSLVLAEVALSYINIGVDPATESWGNMINTARLEMAREPVVWWSLLSAFTFMLLLVLPANLFADALRDALDPRVSD